MRGYIRVLLLYLEKLSQLMFQEREVMEVLFPLLPKFQVNRSQFCLQKALVSFEQLKRMHTMLLVVDIILLYKRF